MAEKPTGVTGEAAPSLEGTRTRAPQHPPKDPDGDDQPRSTSTISARSGPPPSSGNLTGSRRRAPQDDPHPPKLAACPHCNEPRGDAEVCPYCGME